MSKYEKITEINAILAEEYEKEGFKVNITYPINECPLFITTKKGKVKHLCEKKNEPCPLQILNINNIILSSESMKRLTNLHGDLCEEYGLTGFMISEN